MIPYFQADWINGRVRIRCIVNGETTDICGAIDQAVGDRQAAIFNAMHRAHL